MASFNTEELSSPEVKRLPAWFKQEIPDHNKISRMKKMFRTSGLATVCESAHCPNMGQCWSEGVATFMILGDICSRACRFCAIEAGVPKMVDNKEPMNVAYAVKELQCKYVVITSVARDDLGDEGAEQFKETVDAIRLINPETKVELLIPDFSAREELLKIVVSNTPEVIGHNIETVKRLSSKVRPQADYFRSLKVLEKIKSLNKSMLTKSSLMLGLGETEEEIVETFHDLRNVGCDILTLGQYLAPSQLKRHLPVEEYITPDKFDEFGQMGRGLGFKHVMSGPLVRSSYIAEQGYKECMELFNQKEELSLTS